MDYAWNPAKAKENLRKHGIDLADAVLVLEDHDALTIQDSYPDEIRFKTPGMDPHLRVLLVVHTPGDENTIRIISARKADKSEINQYFKGLNHHE